MALPFKKRVLIVEDDQEIRNSFSLIVNSSQKFMVINAYSNCEDAIENINRDKPEIILMDIELPGMNGIQGTKIIKEKACRLTHGHHRAACRDFTSRSLKPQKQT